jgi:hypothetical protein
MKEIARGTDGTLLVSLSRLSRPWARTTGTNVPVVPLSEKGPEMVLASDLCGPLTEGLVCIEQSAQPLNCRRSYD